MKKGYYFYTLLTKEEQQEFKKEMGSRLKKYLSDFFNDFNIFLQCAFMWKHTDKGHDYWQDIWISKRTNKKLKF